MWCGVREGAGKKGARGDLDWRCFWCPPVVYIISSLAASPSCSYPGFQDTFIIYDCFFASSCLFISHSAVPDQSPIPTKALQSSRVKANRCPPKATYSAVPKAFFFQLSLTTVHNGHLWQKEACWRSLPSPESSHPAPLSWLAPTFLSKQTSSIPWAAAKPTPTPFNAPTTTIRSCRCLTRS